MIDPKLRITVLLTQVKMLGAVHSLHGANYRLLLAIKIPSQGNNFLVYGIYHLIT